MSNLNFKDERLVGDAPICILSQTQVSTQFRAEGSGDKGSGDRFLIRLCLKDINTPGRARIHQVSSRNTSLRLQG